MKKIMIDKNEIEVVVEIDELPFVTYDNLSNPPEAIKIQLAKDLDIDLKDVVVYFTYYHINSKFPIRKLSFDEMNFAKFISDLRYADDHKIASLCARVNIAHEEYIRNPLLLARKLAGLPNDHNYRMLLKWRYYLLDPFLNYENSEPPILKPLTKMEMFLVTSNIALGKSIIQGQKVDIRSQLAAVQQLIEAVKELPNPQIQELEETDDSVYESMSIEELKAGIAMTQKQKVVVQPPVETPKKKSVKKDSGVKKTKKKIESENTDETKPRKSTKPKTTKKTDKIKKRSNVEGRPKPKLEKK